MGTPGSPSRHGKLGLWDRRWPVRLKGHEAEKQGYKTGSDVGASGHDVHSKNTGSFPEQRDTIRHKSRMVFLKLLPMDTEHVTQYLFLCCHHVKTFRISVVNIKDRWL